uniref:Putative mrna binding protein n=1 Tax=Phlebotomus kandelakii TaxID=1109342 RepID=A0A6B2EBY6_9DIPT
MENTYGISVDNRYELFYIDDEATDPLEALTVKKKPSAPAKEKSSAAPTVNVSVTKVEKENKAANTKAARQTRAAAATKPEAAHVVTRVNKCASPDVVEKKNRRNVNGGVPGGEEKPRRRRFDAPPRKREFDRQSGSDKTGVKAVDKREGGGAHNWGSHKQEVADELTPKPPAEWSEGETRADGQDTADETTLGQTTGGGGGGGGVGQEEETKELTLDEYKALRAGKSKPPQYNLRKAGEGEDVTQWQKMVALEAKRRAGEADGEIDATSYQQRATRQKHILDIEFHFNDGRRAGQMGRGPRGRPRPPTGGGAGRQVARNRRNEGEERERPPPREHNTRAAHFRDDGGNFHAAPKVDDEKDFPSLGLLNPALVRPKMEAK